MSSRPTAPPSTDPAATAPAGAHEVTIEISVAAPPGAARDAAREIVERLCAVVAAETRPAPAPARVTLRGADGGPGRSRRRPVRHLPADPDLLLRPARRTALLDGAPVPMTRREYDLLLLLARHPYRVLTRNQMLRHAWGYDACLGGRTVDVHVCRIRHKLAGRGPVITTVRGVGYRLDAADRLRIAPD